MTDREALYRAVLAAPADDAPRLVLADWLDEHGEADLAAFIRLQCDLAALPAPPVTLECRELLHPLRGASEPVYRAIVPLADGRAAPEVGRRVTLVPSDLPGRPVADLVLADVGFHPYPGRRPAPYAEVEVSAVPAEPPWDSDGRRAEREAKERDLFLRLGVRPVRVGGVWYEVGLPAEDQPVTLRRGFVDELAVPAADFLHDADDLLAAHPVRILRLDEMPGVERAEGAEPGTVDASLFGRDFWVTVPAEVPDHELMLSLFAAEWPWIEVHLPPGGALAERT